MEIVIALCVFLGGALLLREWQKRNARQASTEAEKALIEAFEKQGMITEGDEEGARVSPRETVQGAVSSLAHTLDDQAFLTEGRNGLLANLDRALTLAGRPRNWTAAEALAATLMLWAAAVVLLGIAVVMAGFPPNLAALVLAIIFLYPPLSLRSARIRRQDAARFELLDVINTLRLNVSGNSPLPDAIGRMVNEVPESDTDMVLIAELRQAYREYQIGNRDFSEALQAAGDRLGVHSVNDFIDAIVQARRTGSPIIDVLESQYDQALVLYDEELQTLIGKKVMPMTISLVIVMCGALVWLVGPLLLDALRGITAA